MLVLSRQRDETIMIGDEIEITVVDIRGDKVRLGITAPTKIAVHRKEVYEAIKRENEQAARITGADLPRAADAISPGPARLRVGTKAHQLAAPAKLSGMTIHTAGANGSRPAGDTPNLSVRRA